MKAFITPGVSTARLHGNYILHTRLENNLSDESTGDSSSSMSRRSLIEKTKQSVIGATLASPITEPANAASKSRSDGYPVQYSEREWAYMLSGSQYNILRQGGTERPYSSILEGEERDGIYQCAGCKTPLFSSSMKFHSGTGWPSFAACSEGVEVENVNAFQANLAGAEVRCATCGGHLGDVFNDGFLFVNTPAFKTGKRYCIDGAALIFKPSDSSEDVYGDTPPPRKNNDEMMPSFLQPPKINPTNR
eukprot:CAMPEP_0178958952 /NCGR_PEP_ID=MMETSP0789-20121207/11970_1 /TAXON_ID=3005 /ORGANISM="Rhizosolenia setigera, Strain CCMP 1694" /LENGTH=247 /DNA_ID=CAMNT_0020641799 /DNA_START=80 /DNA_END=823 /DNA_ORIENTATION=+